MTGLIKLDFARDDVTLEEIEKEFGITHYNYPPTNFREISEKEFAQSHFHIYTPIAISFAQIYLNPNPNRQRDAVHSVKYFFMHDMTGYAIGADYWDGKVHYYKFGCDHDYRQVSQEECRDRDIVHFGRCYHVSECKKCGFLEAIDSSD